MRTILSIETSCDETSAAVLEKASNGLIVHSNIVATSSEMHATTGGIIPENAARMQVESIMPVICEALLEYKKLKVKTPKKKSQEAVEILKKDIDAIAITHGPGLIGSLLVGVETAKTLSFAFNKPLIPINHLLAHIYANFLDGNAPILFPFTGLIVSGGHTDLVYFKSHTNFVWLGGTRDDAAGECLDKSGRLLNLPYPAGPEIEKRAATVTHPTIKFQSPLLNSDDYDFSFSGLKAEVSRFIQTAKDLDDEQKNEICAALQTAIFDVLISKTLKAVKEFRCQTVLLGGGVSANQTLLNNFKKKAEEQNVSIAIYSPERAYATDNAAMIGAYALLNPITKPWNQINAIPELYFD